MACARTSQEQKTGVAARHERLHDRRPCKPMARHFHERCASVMFPSHLGKGTALKSLKDFARFAVRIPHTSESFLGLQTPSPTDRQTDRQTDTHTHIYIYTYTHTHPRKHTQTQEGTQRQTDGRTDRQTDRKTARQTGRQADRQADRPTYKQTHAPRNSECPASPCDAMRDQEPVFQGMIIKHPANSRAMHPVLQRECPSP